MKNSNLKKALKALEINKEMEIINPETVKGGVGCNSFRCRTYSKPPKSASGLTSKI